MAIITGTAALPGVGSIPKIVDDAGRGQHVHVPVKKLIKLNNRAITAHNRRLDITTVYVYDDVTVLSGNKRRFLKAVKQSIGLQWRYMPSESRATVDGQYSRDYLQEIIASGLNIEVYIQDSPNDPGKHYEMFVESYDEDLIRREITWALLDQGVNYPMLTGVHWFNVSLKLKEL